jgi:hypothetical protein
MQATCQLCKNKKMITMNLMLLKIYKSAKLMKGGEKEGSFGIVSN